MKIRTEKISPVLASDGERTWFKDTIEHYQCDNCGEYIHESYPHYRNKYINLRYELDNGITLCVGCHREEHKKRR